MQCCQENLPALELTSQLTLQLLHIKMVIKKPQKNLSKADFISEKRKTYVTESSC